MEGPKLVVLSKVMRGSTFSLEKESISVGGSGSTIVIEDATISREHAELRRDMDGSYVVCDKGSTNGTRVNGELITTQKIRSGDVVQFGSIEALFTDGSEVELHDVTQTSFDITQTAGSIELPDDFGNMNPFASKSQGSKGTLILSSVIVLLLILVVVLGALVVSNAGA